MPISRVAQDEINASQAIKSANALTSKVADAFARTFGYSGSFNPVRSATYVGKDSQGNPVYKVRYSDPRGGFITTRTYSLSGGKLVHPETITQQTMAQNAEAQRQQVTQLQNTKSKWLGWLAEHRGEMSQNEFDQFKNRIENFEGDPARLERDMWVASRNLPFGATGEIADDGSGDGLDPFAGLDLGGGGGFAGPVYRAPDRRVVEDMAKGMLTSLVGTIPDDLVDSLADLYMKDHRRNFDSPNAEIDPAQSMLEAIRNTETYQEIHALRPDSEDERSWISQRRAAAQQGGLENAFAEDFAIQQATVGGDVPDVADAAAIAQTDESGSTRGTLIEGKLKQVATSMFEGAR